MTGKVVAISGGASGIGLGTAQVFLSRGGKVSIADICEKSTKAAQSSLSEKYGADNILGSVCDVSDRSSVRGWIQTTVNHFGRLDGAANVAATQGRTGQYDSRIGNVDPEDWGNIIKVNLTGVMYCMQEQLKAMQGNAAGGGSINVSSYV